MASGTRSSKTCASATRLTLQSAKHFVRAAGTLVISATRKTHTWSYCTSMCHIPPLPQRCTIFRSIGLPEDYVLREGPAPSPPRWKLHVHRRGGIAKREIVRLTSWQSKRRATRSAVGSPESGRTPQPLHIAWVKAVQPTKGVQTRVIVVSAIF